MPYQIGETVSRFSILEKLGEGGMGLVYRARDTRLNRDVALKFLPPTLTSEKEANRRFLQEARAASALDHPNICTIHEIGETGDGVLFIVMSCYEGETLKERISRGQLKLDEAVSLTLQITQGLAKAHAKGIVHRDIKPANILVTADNVPKILDFGLAKLVGQSGLTKSGSTMGTFAYMSPEQVRGEDVDHRTDLWSLGATLYEMLAGVPPFRGEHEAAVIYEILNGTPPPLPRYRPDVPEDLQLLVSKLLHKDPAGRIPSAESLAEELTRRPAQLSPSPAENSIAVLYFENMSSEKDTDYFCAGITEDIITDLSKIRSLKVVPRGDVLPFRNREINVSQLGDVLRASHVLEGSVRKAGNRIRITAQLTDVRTGYHVWADRFDRLLEDIFDIQNEVSGKIAEALRLSLTDSERASLSKKPTDDLRAYDFYMRGKELLLHRGRKNTDAAIQMFERAIAIDPNFVGALSGLAEACSHMFTWLDGDPKWLARMIELSEKALALDPGALDARFALGTVYFHQKRHAEATRVFEQLVNEKTDFYEGFLWLGMVHQLADEQDDAAIQAYRRAIEVRPYSEEPWIRLDMAYRRKGERELADGAARKALEAGTRRLELNPDDAVTRSRVAACHARLGHRDMAIDEVRKIHETDPTDCQAHFNAACALATLREKEKMLECLRIAAGAKVFHSWIMKDPDFDGFRQDPDFLRLVEEFE